MQFSIETWQDLLNQHYTKIAKNMQDLPVYHSQLNVFIHPFTEIKQGRFLGGLITPWFMSWIFKLVDEMGNDCHVNLFTAKVGQVVSLRFPSGEYEFMVNFNEGLGYYYTCALVSDMHTMASQEVAQSLLEHSLAYLFDEKMKAETTRQGEIRQYAQTGTLAMPEQSKPQSISSIPASAQALEQAEQGKNLTQSSVKLNEIKQEEAQEHEDAETIDVSRRRLFGLGRRP